ncbi:MAG: hypothetical protein F2663_03405 [Actinobacteria bacterium]|uniref:Unannotated protein n=1 Tax=freshwater metagenome TaxID=449393 RepID=A0A6J6NWH6_9ZZZZ|nr:hypothetical protein [Actinomycetota bacterium]
MAPFLIVVLGAGCLSLLRSDRFDQLAPVRARWVTFEPRARAYVRTAPATFAYLFVLLITTWVLQNSSSRLGNRLLLEQSTNIHELTRQPVRVLVASAFFVPDIWEFLSWLVLFVVFVAPLEHRLGSARTAGVFAFGHVGSTLITAAGLWLAVDADLIEKSVVNARDVGASYGFVALGVVLAAGLQGRVRWLAMSALTTGIAADLALTKGYTALGHVVAFALGLAIAPIVWRRAHVTETS